MQKVHRHLVSRLRLLVSVLVQIFSLPYEWVLFTFPSQYLCTIDLQSICWLRRWFSCVQTVNVLLIHTALWYYTGLSPSVVQYSKSFYSQSVWCHCRVLSPILTASRLMSFPVATEMFQFTTCDHFMCGFPRWGLCTLQTELRLRYNVSQRKAPILALEPRHPQNTSLVFCSQRWT